MPTLKLTMMLGPVERIEVAELAMPDMTGCLFAADAIEGWDADEVERVLMAAGNVFRQAIAMRKHEQTPAPPPDPVGDSLARLRPPPHRFPLEIEAARLEGLDAETAAAAMAAKKDPEAGRREIAGPAMAMMLARDAWGDPTPAARLATEADACPLSLRAEIARKLAPEAWVEADASLQKADEVLAVIEGRRAA